MRKSTVIAAFACLFAFASFLLAQARPVHRADRILILKAAHTLTLLSGGEAIRTYKVALGDPKGPKVQAGDKKTRKVLTSSTAKTPTASFTAPCIFPIRIRPTVNERANSVSAQEATSRSMVFQRNMPGWVPRIAPSTGRQGVLP